MLGNNKNYIFWIACFLSVFIFSGCGKDTWTGVYYPDGCLICDNDYIYSPPYDSLDGCRKWINTTRNSRLDKEESYDYECGKNCKSPDDYGIMVCKETLK